jgi:hypothetical protein
MDRWTSPQAGSNGRESIASSSPSDRGDHKSESPGSSEPVYDRVHNCRDPGDSRGRDQPEPGSRIESGRSESRRQSLDRCVGQLRGVRVTMVGMGCRWPCCGQWKRE